MKTREEMSFLIRESSSRDKQGYTISVYSNGGVRHSPIFCDGFDLMLMAISFTSLTELVGYFSRKPIFSELTLQKPAKLYSDFTNEPNRSKTLGTQNSAMAFKQLENNISLKVDTLRARKFSFH